jgi:hypothetical protein
MSKKSDQPPPHPRVDFIDALTVLDKSPAALGYRMPAEWEPLDALWVTPPHNEETWPGCLDKAQAQFDAFMAAAGRYVKVRTTQSLGVATNDSWIRDYGPIFVVRDGDAPERAAAATGLFTPLVLQMLAVGEETGRVDEMMDEMADYYDRDVQNDVDNLGALMEPLLIIIVGGVVLMLALGVFLPMWDLAGAAMKRG